MEDRRQKTEERREKMEERRSEEMREYLCPDSFLFYLSSSLSLIRSAGIGFWHVPDIAVK